MSDSYKAQSQSRLSFSGLSGPFDLEVMPAASTSVARVRPRASKGITDLLLLNLVQLNVACPSKKQTAPDTADQVSI